MRLEKVLEGRSCLDEVDVLDQQSLLGVLSKHRQSRSVVKHLMDGITIGQGRTGQGAS